MRSSSRKLKGFGSHREVEIPRIKGGEGIEACGVYVGTVPALKGKTAVLLRSGMGWLAQFDDIDATYAGINVGHRWHWFGKKNFSVFRFRSFDLAANFVTDL